MATVTCQSCGQEMTARSSRARFCYGSCYRSHENKAAKARRSTWSEERRRAMYLVQKAVASGELVRGACEVCQSRTRIDAHHDDYSKPLQVRWLCRSHHRQHHANARKRA